MEDERNLKAYKAVPEGKKILRMSTAASGLRPYTRHRTYKEAYRKGRKK